MTAARFVIAAAAMIAATAAVYPLAAQVVVQDDESVVTDVVHLFDTRTDDAKSIPAAMAMSLALPGSGHHYLERHKSAYLYLSVDIASIFGAIAFHGLARQRESEARSFAVVAAGIERAPPGEAFWRHVGAHMDAADYNEMVALSRGDAAEYIDPETWWRWGDESQRDDYNDIRQQARSLRVASSFFLGALIANRIVSTIELRAFNRRAVSSGIRFESVMSPDMKGAAVMMRANF